MLAELITVMTQAGIHDWSIWRAAATCSTWSVRRLRGRGGETDRRPGRPPVATTHEPIRRRLRPKPRRSGGPVATARLDNERTNQLGAARRRPLLRGAPLRPLPPPWARRLLRRLLGEDRMVGMCRATGCSRPEDSSARSTSRPWAGKWGVPPVGRDGGWGESFGGVGASYVWTGDWAGT